jgi:predicted nucleic acid-binding protein
MKKPSVYFDTSFFSALHYSGRVLECIHRQVKTQEWWRHERRHYELWNSNIVERELSNGVFRDQLQSLAAAKRIRYLVRTVAVDQIMRNYLALKIVPENKFADAYHLAFCAVYEMDYLMSWNYAHLANPEVQVLLMKENTKTGLKTPKLVTPDSIPQKRFGQELMP